MAFVKEKETKMSKQPKKEILYRWDEKVRDYVPVTHPNPNPHISSPYLTKKQVIKAIATGFEATYTPAILPKKEETPLISLFKTFGFWYPVGIFVLLVALATLYFL